MDYLKQNHLSLLIIAFLIVSALLNGGASFGANRETTTITNPFNFTQGLTATTGTFSGAISATTGAFSGLVTSNAGELHSYTNSTSTVLATQTLVQADILNYDTVLLGTINVSGTALTFPATSTVTSYLPTAGDSAKQCWYNATSTANLKLTFVAGAGWDFEVASTTLGAAATLANSPILSGNAGCFTYIRKANTDILAEFVPFVDGD